MKKSLLILACCTAVIIATITVVSWLSWQPQAWYAPPDFSQPEVVKLAERAEYRLNEEFHTIRPIDEVWNIRITDEIMNAWLVGRLEGWLTHDQDMELPPEIRHPQIHTTTEGIWLAALIEFDGADPRPLALELWVWIDEGKLFVEPISLRLGKVPIPISFFTKAIDEMHQEMQGVEAIAPLMDDREVEIQALTLENGSIILTCQTHLPR